MTWFFDFLIVSFLVLGVIVVVLFIHQFFDLRKAKRNFKRQILLGIATVIIIVGVAIVAYGSFIEPRLVKTRSETVTLREGGTHAMRLALISDFHAGNSLSDSTIRQVIKIIRAQNPPPDAILIAGDFIGHRNSELTQLEALGNLKPIPLYGVLGNHDYLDDTTVFGAMLSSFGISILKNENVSLESGGVKLAIVGIDDIWFGRPDFDRALSGLPDDVPRILLAHNPDIVHATGTHRFDAIFAGHTHGGQIRLPFIGAIPEIPTSLGRSYDRGVFDWQGTPLVITQGIGTTGPRARLFAPPEVMIIDAKF